MNTKTKAFTVIAAALVICILIYSPLTQAAQTNVSLGDELTVAEIEEFKPDGFHVHPRVRFAVWFLNHADPTEIEGTVVALAQKKLILNTDEEQIRVNMPRQWTIENEVVTLEELFESYVSDGENITVKALGADMINKEGLRIYLLVGYELITESEIKVSANLRVNIED